MMGPLLSTFTPDMGLLRSMEIKSAVNRFMTNMYLGLPGFYFSVEDYLELIRRPLFLPSI